MKIKIPLYISGISGGLLLVAWFVGVAIKYPHSTLLLLIGLAILALIYLPLQIVLRVQHRRKIKQIIADHQDREGGEIPGDAEQSGARGWGMNSSPFRRRKSGLSWGGGNIHAANANRGERRTFMKR